MPRERMVAPVSESYTATSSSTPRSRQWMADIEGTGPHLGPLSGQGEAVRRGGTRPTPRRTRRRGVGPHHLPAPAVARSGARSSRARRHGKDRRRGRAARAAEAKAAAARALGPRRPPVHGGTRRRSSVSRTSASSSCSPADNGLGPMLANGVAPKVAAERLGHSDPSLFMNLYSHVTPSMQREAADKIGAALFGEVLGPRCDSELCCASRQLDA